MKRKALGKGLSALLPDPEFSEPSEGLTAQVALERLDPNPFQPRLKIAAKALEELTASIRESGMLQPILVRRTGERYQIIAGERRFRAAQKLGLRSVPVAIREVRDEQLLELALVENIQREELAPLEEAQAYARLQAEFSLTQEEMAKKVGRERSTVANTLRLLKLPREVKELMSQGRLDAGHARALLALEQAGEQIALARQAAKRGLSVREVERRVAFLKAPPRRGAARKDANTRAAEERLRGALGTKVEIKRRGQGGSLRLAFTSEAELNRLFELLLRKAR